MDCNLHIKQPFGFCDKRIQDWLNAHIYTIGPPLDQKRMARLAHLNIPCTEKLDKLKNKHTLVQCFTREAQRLFWEDICCKVQNSDYLGDIAGVHVALKHSLDPTLCLAMELRDLN